MPQTPNITLTATLQDITGNPAGSLANPAKLQIALCGYGATIPEIVGTSVLARTGPFELFSTGGEISTQLWGNDVITPPGTYYAITILDGENNVVQTGAYQFTGTQTIDLSHAAQIVGPAGVALATLQYLPCTGAVPGSNYVAPGTVVMVFLNGNALRPTVDYTVSGGSGIALTFTTNGPSPGFGGDEIYALCVVS